MSTFRVEFKVDANQLGVVLASIHGRVNDLDVSLIEDVPHTTNKKKQQQPRQGSIREMVLEAIRNASEQGISLEEGRKLLEQAGYAPTSLYALKSALVKKGLIDYRNGKMSAKK